jgi:spore germination cell wall hydrolase CwlJ-like protein
MMLEALFCLTLNAYLESRGEPYTGQIAVSQVVLRRAGLDRTKVCEEVYRADQFTGPWNSPRHKPKNAKPAEWARAERAARAALVWAEHGIGQDYSRGATHYHNLTVRPYWTRCAKQTVQIARHKFYNAVQPCRR